MHNSNAMTDGQLILDEPAYICFLFKAPKPRRMAPEGTFCHRLFSFSLFSPSIYPFPSPSIQLPHPLFVPFSAPPSPPPSLSLSLSATAFSISLPLALSVAYQNRDKDCQLITFCSLCTKRTSDSIWEPKQPGLSLERYITAPSVVC